MVKTFFDIDLNNFFVSPFDVQDILLHPPYEILKNENDQKKFETNFMIDYALLYYYLKHKSYIDPWRDGKWLYFSVNRKTPKYEIIFNESEGYKITKLLNYLTFKVELVRRDSLEDVSLHADKHKVMLDQNHKWLVNIGNIHVDNDNVGETYHFETRSQEELDEFKLLLLEYSYILHNLFSKPENFPYYKKHENILTIEFPKIKNYRIKAGKSYAKIKEEKKG